MNTVGRLKFDDEEEENGQQNVSRDVTEETLCQAENAANLVRRNVKKAKPAAKSKANTVIFKGSKYFISATASHLEDELP